MNRIKFLSVFTLITALVSCTGNSGKQDQKPDSAAVQTPEPSDAYGEEAKPVVSDADFLISEVKKKDMLLFGQEIEVEYNQIYATLQLVTPGVVKQISNAGAVMTGPMVFLYDALPANTESVKMFVGIPVKSKFKNEGETGFRQIKAGTFYRMDCDADAGNTLNDHLKMQKILKEKNLNFSAPVMEIMSESRNDEMTVVSKAGLFYLKK